MLNFESSMQPTRSRIVALNIQISQLARSQKTRFTQPRDSLRGVNPVLLTDKPPATPTAGASASLCALHASCMLWRCDAQSCRQAHDELLTEETRHGENPSEKLAHPLRAHWQVVGVVTVCPPSARGGRGAGEMIKCTEQSPFSTVEMGPQVERESSKARV
jgi:hypothetical protein